MNPDKVTVESVESNIENTFIFNVYFSELRGNCLRSIFIIVFKRLNNNRLGDANEIKLTSSSAKMQNKEVVKGVALLAVFQMQIDGEWTSVINFQNDSISQVCLLNNFFIMNKYSLFNCLKVSQKVNDLFRIRCANSISTKTDDVYIINDYEFSYCSDNAFCGRKACQISYSTLFNNIDANIVEYKQVKAPFFIEINISIFNKI